jgi:hypothetical protein
MNSLQLNHLPYLVAFPVFLPFAMLGALMWPNGETWSEFVDVCEVFMCRSEFE